MASPCKHEQVTLETLKVRIDREWYVAARTWVCGDCGSILKHLCDDDLFRESLTRRSTIKPVSGVGKYE